tara:strand:- start:1935 stop:2162 length:228 start_codon:yes stop_codon:yes gene_type:complete
MSKIFGGGGDGGAGAAIAKQTEQVKQQQAAVDVKESNLAVETMANVKARRRGGVRALLSPERLDELGVLPTKLGG